LGTSWYIPKFLQFFRVEKVMSNDEPMDSYSERSPSRGGADDLKLRSLRWLVVEPSIELGITGM
jgi:hypothetical protein